MGYFCSLQSCSKKIRAVSAVGYAKDDELYHAQQKNKIGDFVFQALPALNFRFALEQSSP